MVLCRHTQIREEFRRWNGYNLGINDLYVGGMKAKEESTFKDCVEAQELVETIERQPSR